jgi:hypothetical protein
MAFIYGLLYLFLTAYPLVFQKNYHMTQGIGGLPFFGMIAGQLLAGGMMVLRQPGYARKLKANNNIPIPEWRLPEVIAGGVAFAGGLFWLGWAGYTGKVHWIVPTLSGLLSGFGLMAIFLQALNYLVDSYIMVSAFIPIRRLLTEPVRRVGHRRQHVPALAVRRGLPAVRLLHVHRHGHPVGVHAARLPRDRDGARARVVLPAGRGDQEEEQIRADGVPAGAEGEGGGLMMPRNGLVVDSCRCKCGLSVEQVMIML